MSPTRPVLVLALALLLGGCGDSSNSHPSVNATRGQYLVEAVLACGDCHTTPQANGLPSFNPSDFLAGGREFDAQVGAASFKFYSRNLTSDKENGLGSWTDDQIKRAITTGVDDQNGALFPIMPYWAFGNIGADDLSAIVKYLRTLPPNANAVPDNTFNLTSPAKIIDASSRRSAVATSPG